VRFIDAAGVAALREPEPWATPRPDRLPALDQDTLALGGLLDGSTLTILRTATVSVAAVLDRLPDRALRVVVIGAGPQAIGHVATMAAVRLLEDATYLVRRPSPEIGAGSGMA
jgi:hypothetical protein